MPIGVLILVVLLALAIGGIWLTFSLVGVLVTVAVAAVVGWLADKIVPGDLPYGWLGAIVAGLVGSWIGTGLLGRTGPTIGGIAIVPAIVGAVLVAFVVEIVAKRFRGARTA